MNENTQKNNGMIAKRNMSGLYVISDKLVFDDKTVFCYGKTDGDVLMYKPSIYEAKTFCSLKSAERFLEKAVGRIGNIMYIDNDNSLKSV